MVSAAARSRKSRFLYRQHREAISFPLFPTAFHQLILESLQVFHNSDGIFAPCLPLSTDDINGILHISNCGFIMRKRRNVLMNCTSKSYSSERCRAGDTRKLKNARRLNRDGAFHQHAINIQELFSILNVLSSQRK